MIFEWDEKKRLLNIDKHGLDFIDCELVFAGPCIGAPARTVAGEERTIVTGLVEDVYVTVVYTRRNDATRIISLRKARHEERERHRALHGG